MSTHLDNLHALQEVERAQMLTQDNLNLRATNSELRENIRRLQHRIALLCLMISDEKLEKSLSENGKLQQRNQKLSESLLADAKLIATVEIDPRKRNLRKPSRKLPRNERKR